MSFKKGICLILNEFKIFVRTLSILIVLKTTKTGEKMRCECDFIKVNLITAKTITYNN